MANSRINRAITFLVLALAVAGCASRSAGRGAPERPSRSGVRGAGERSSRSMASGPQTTAIIAGRQVVIWAPTNGSAPQPVVIFSHGFHGCATQSKFLMEAIASHGYWVLAPNHKDALCTRGGGFGRSEEPLGKPEEWTDATYADRGEDIRAILKALADSAGIAQKMDLHRLVLSGHSLGGYTVLGLAGAWPSWKISGVTAVLALSPYAQPFVVHNTLGNLNAPAMYQGGTLDFGITPFVKKRGGAYDLSPAPKYFVEFSGAGHLAWTDLSDKAHSQIVSYSLAFLDHFLSQASDDPLKQTIPGVSDLRYAP
jgi:pimeloyl-ACP methyl ester carboxylesterase